VTPVARLRRWHLVELVGGLGPLDARLAVDEAVVHHIAGLAYPDPRLEPWLRPQTVSRDVVTDAATDAIAAAWQSAPSLADAPVARLEGGDGEAFAKALARCLGLRLHRLSEHGLPPVGPEREQLARLWEREALLRGGLLWVDADPLGSEVARQIGEFLDNLQSLILITGETAVPMRRAQHRLTPSDADGRTRLAAWRQCLGDRAAELNGELGSLAEQFHLSGSAFARVAERWASTPGTGATQLWDECRAEARRGLDALAQRVDARATWADLVLPDAALATLRTIAAQVRQRTRVYRDWGFADRTSRGLGISALFAGGSGTGKTLAAEVLANELRLDLYRIDLAALVSKYIGQTEKNLARVFATAEASGAVLLFDEADALFGKRSEVRDSHDRYANLEVSYLLQRVETYRGLAILTTNLKQAIDPAFQRRLRFIVPFPFPDAGARAAIWERAFPPAAPLGSIDIGKLTRLSLSGGHIRNLALNAAFLAADEGSAITMRHLRSAAEAEFAKLERPLPAAEVADWT
jgi:hypothetical protein